MERSAASRMSIWLAARWLPYSPEQEGNSMPGRYLRLADFWAMPFSAMRFPTAIRPWMSKVSTKLVLYVVTSIVPLLIAKSSTVLPLAKSQEDSLSEV